MAARNDSDSEVELGALAENDVRSDLSRTQALEDAKVDSVSNEVALSAAIKAEKERLESQRIEIERLKLSIDKVAKSIKASKDEKEAMSDYLSFAESTGVRDENCIPRRSDPPRFGESQSISKVDGCDDVSWEKELPLLLGDAFRAHSTPYIKSRAGTVRMQNPFLSEEEEFRALPEVCVRKKNSQKVTMAGDTRQIGNRLTRNVLNDEGRMLRQEYLSSNGAFSRSPDVRPRDIRVSYRDEEDVKSDQGDQTFTREKAKMKMIFPDKYNGNNTTLNDYLKHYELVSELNGWDSLEKAQFLAVNLRGDAQKLLSSLDRDELRDYNRLVGALEERFGTEGQEEMFLAQLRSRQKKEKESYQELADEISRLVHRAYPNAPVDMVRRLTVQSFMYAITDVEILQEVRRARPHSVKEAVLVCIEQEAFKSSDQQRGFGRRFAVREVSFEDDSNGSKKNGKVQKQNGAVQEVKSVGGSPSEDMLLKMVEQLSAKLTSLENQIQKSGKDGKPKKKVPLEEVQCYKCKQMGHYKSSCPQRADASFVSGDASQGENSGNF